MKMTRRVMRAHATTAISSATIRSQALWRVRAVSAPTLRLQTETRTYREMNAQMFAESRDLSSNTVVVRKDFTPKTVSRDHARRGFVGSENKKERKAGGGVWGRSGKVHYPSYIPTPS